MERYITKREIERKKERGRERERTRGKREIERKRKELFKLFEFLDINIAKDEGAT